MRVLLIGLSGTGKTALLEQLDEARRPSDAPASLLVPDAPAPSLVR